MTKRRLHTDKHNEKAVNTGYLRGFGESLKPTLISLFGICGLRLFWVYGVFYRNPSYSRLLMIYPVSLGITMILMILLCVLIRGRLVIQNR